MSGEVDDQSVNQVDIRTAAYTTPQRQKRAHGSLDDNGKMDVNNLRHRSSEKLRLAWESIYDKFQDAHLQAQDEIYLGRRGVKGDQMRVIVDRGHLRSISKKTLEFGCFHIDEAEVIGCDQEGNTDMSQEISNSPSPLPTPLVLVNRFEDTDLSDFLKAEAQRKQLYPQDSEEEDIPPTPVKKSKSKIAKPISGCPGSEKCTKSLCFLCGGIGSRNLVEDE